MAARPDPSVVRNLRTIGIRVSDEASLVFDIARVAYNRRSLQELLRPVLEAEAERLAEVPEVKAMLGAAKRMRQRRQS